MFSESVNLHSSWSSLSCCKIEEALLMHKVRSSQYRSYTNYMVGFTDIHNSKVFKKVIWSLRNSNLYFISSSLKDLTVEDVTIRQRDVRKIKSSASCAGHSLLSFRRDVWASVYFVAKVELQGNWKETRIWLVIWVTCSIIHFLCHTFCNSQLLQFIFALYSNIWEKKSKNLNIRMVLNSKLVLYDYILWHFIYCNQT